jgi:hypothetical protein
MDILPSQGSQYCGDLQRFDIIYDGNRKKSVRPRGMPLVTLMFPSSEQAWDNGILECKFLSKTEHRASDTCPNNPTDQGDVVVNASTNTAPAAAATPGDDLPTTSMKAGAASASASTMSAAVDACHPALHVLARFNNASVRN